MKTWLRNLMDATSVMTTTRAIFDLVMLSTKELGFEHFSYIHVDATNLSRLTTLSNFPPQWQARYLEGRYDAFDPVLSRARQCAHAFLWNGEELLRGSRASIRKMFIEAYDLGIRAGVAIPFETGLRGRGDIHANDGGSAPSSVSETRSRAFCKRGHLVARPH